MSLYEILVPQTDRDGEFIPIPVHNVWDDNVRKITGGLTINRSGKGYWVSPSGELISERMIPVKISCTQEQIMVIALMTKTFYKQDAVMFYKISDEVFII